MSVPALIEKWESQLDPFCVANYKLFAIELLEMVKANDWNIDPSIDKSAAAQSIDNALEELRNGS